MEALHRLTNLPYSCTILSFITYMLGVHNYFETFSAAIMFSSDRDLSEHCGTDCASYCTKMEQQRYTKCIHETTRLEVKWLPNDKYETDKIVQQGTHSSRVGDELHRSPQPSVSDYALKQERYTLDLPEYLFTSVL